MQESLKDYNFFRLQSFTGKLDKNLVDTWNIVAIPGNGYWSELRGHKHLFDRSVNNGDN
jgi:hypothetical protein